MLQCCARPSVRLSVVCNICVVAKRCILAKNWLKKQIGDRLWQIEWSRDRWRHVTLKDHKVMTPILIGPNIPKTDCYLATITNCYSLLWGSALGYPGDSLASCLFFDVCGLVVAKSISFHCGWDWECCLMIGRRRGRSMATQHQPRFDDDTICIWLTSL